MFAITPGVLARFARAWRFVIGFLLVASVGAAERFPLVGAPVAQNRTSPASEKITFNQHIRPILSDNCFACHGTDAEHRKGDRRVDTAEGAMADIKGVRAVVPGSLEASELWQRIISPHEDEVMPPPESHKPPLKPDQRELIRRWIEQGAEYQRHWAYEPVSRPEPPPALAGAAPHPVDQFIGAKLASKNLRFSREAPPEALLRRVTLDLTGLPPSPEEVDAYLSDSKPGAYERAVDRLLASSRFGEQFGRHWLDAVRYADTHGLHLDNVRSIWPYRDWVVTAFNRNMPFDQFTIEQLAGDMLPNPTVQQLVASGYNRNILTTSEAGAIESEVDMRNTAERVDTTAAVWMGMTANCASCHDHKFDPLTQKDYYSLGAIFKGLSDRTWDANVLTPAPALIIAGDPETQVRIQKIDEDVKRLEAVVSAKADKITGNAPLPKYDAVPITYDVVWAEDSDMVAPSYLSRPPLPGEWRRGTGTPVMSGERALRLEGAAERPIAFAAGDSILMVRTSAVAFAHVYLDPANPPRAVSLEFESAEKTTRMIWGDLDAFGPEVAKNSLRGGELPAAGGYVRLSLSACDSGVEEGKLFTGIKLGQSDGVAWWDQMGATLTSPKASEDPLLSRSAWNLSIRRAWPGFDQVGMRNDINFIVRINDVLRDADEIQKLDRWYRDYVYAPLRSELERETHAVRVLLAEQIHYETTLPMTMISKEREKPLPSHVLIRGQYDKPGEPVDAATPAFLPPAPTTGGRVTRLDFAHWLVSPENPLTSRVTVNRLWGQLFGAGLVRTPADFGSQGEPPTHPELLDWLASEFMRTGWDTKNLVRLIVMSRTYRQDSRVSPELLELDPENKLLARGSRLRLDAEVLRDQALSFGGLLRTEMGGPPVKPYQPVNVWEPVAFAGSNTMKYKQDEGSALYRRSLYSFWKRTAPAPAMVTFDAPSRENFCLARPRSNTPLQALALMNDVQQFEAARAFAERLLTRPGQESERLAYAFRAVTARAAEPDELSVVAGALAQHRAHFESRPEVAAQTVANGESKPSATLSVTELAAWTMVTNLLMNLDEAVNRN